MWLIAYMLSQGGLGRQGIGRYDCFCCSLFIIVIMFYGTFGCIIEFEERGLFCNLKSYLYSCICR